MFDGSITQWQQYYEGEVRVVDWKSLYEMEASRKKGLICTITNLRYEIIEIRESAKSMANGRSDKYIASLHKQIKESEACVLVGPKCISKQQTN